MQNKSEYPEQLEEAWIRMASEATGKPVPSNAVSSLEREAGAISDAFTTGRDPAFAGYASKRRALAAYGLFFFPRAFVRVKRVLQECRSELQNGGKPLQVLDLGAGTGAAGLAVASVLPNAKLHMVDLAPESLKAAKRIFDENRELWPSASLSVESADASSYKTEKEFDLIISSFAINEWMEKESDDDNLLEWAKEMIRSLKPGGVLILLEPSQHESIDRLIRLRNKLAEQEAGNIIAPCPHHEACPMHAEKRGWCHEVRKWRPPESMFWINRNLQRDIKMLKFSFVVIQRGKPQKKDWMRIVSPARKEKGKFGFHGCGNDGKLHTCEWLNRKLSDEQLALSEELERGDRVNWKPAKTLGDGKTERSDGPPVRFRG